MKRAAAILAVGLVAVTWVGCAPDFGRELSGPESGEVEFALERARSATDQLGGRLMTALSEQLEAGGGAAAVTVCSEIAPSVAAELSRDGVEIRRTSRRYRNPDNAPEAWESSELLRLEQLLAAGELPKEVHEVDDGSGELRYLRPIVVAPQCLQCHGGEGELAPDVRERLARSYPGDRATGFEAGDLRGAFSVRVRIDNRNPT